MSGGNKCSGGSRELVMGVLFYKGDVVTFEQRPKKSEGIVEIQGKEHHGRMEQLMQRPWSGHIFDMFDEQQGG